MKNKESMRKYNLEYKRKHKEKLKKHREEWARKNIKTNRDYIKNLLSSSVCADCGESDWRVLEFDHIRDKKYNVGTIANRGYKLDTVIKEVEKCEVVCANCHRLRTIASMDTWRNNL